MKLYKFTLFLCLLAIVQSKYLVQITFLTEISRRNSRIIVKIGDQSPQTVIIDDSTKQKVISDLITMDVPIIIYRVEEEIYVEQTQQVGKYLFKTANLDNIFDYTDDIYRISAADLNRNEFLEDEFVLQINIYDEDLLEVDDFLKSKKEEIRRIQEYRNKIESRILTISCMRYFEKDDIICGVKNLKNHAVRSQCKDLFDVITSKPEFKTPLDKVYYNNQKKGIGYCTTSIVEYKIHPSKKLKSDNDIPGSSECIDTFNQNNNYAKIQSNFLDSFSENIKKDKISTDLAEELRAKANLSLSQTIIVLDVMYNKFGDDRMKPPTRSALNKFTIKKAKANKPCVSDYGVLQFDGFVEIPNKSAYIISEKILSILKQYKLSPINIVTDTEPTNTGCKNGVIVRLQRVYSDCTYSPSDSNLPFYDDLPKDEERRRDYLLLLQCVEAVRYFRTTHWFAIINLRNQPLPLERQDGIAVQYIHL
ncbi:hypothetical protein A3Q56_03183 [Intoshia linei]|uniref:Uncharacterized protein n=1 Tax=Intoshia linei TaxID=1819745 RepID=A0A177B6J4_9BILA|nr:hypothetical protein A3Q56_03183 [Intoshia linei]